MKNIKSKIFEYYADLKNQIDIECEKLIELSDQTASSKDKYNLIRLKFLEEIDSTLKLNLKIVDREKNHNEKNYNIFKERFCFFIPISSVRPNFFKNERIGNLIVTNQYVSYNVRNYLRSEKKNSPKLKAKDVVMKILLEKLIEPRILYYDIIDLSNRNRNIIEELNFLDFTINDFSHEDFDSVQTLINQINLKTCDFKLNVCRLRGYALTKFDQIEKLKLAFSKPCEIEPNSFLGLENLKSLYLEFLRLDTLNNFILNGLDNLEILSIANSQITTLSDIAFKNLTKITIITIDKCSVESIDSTTFQGLLNLKFLSLIENCIIKFPRNTLIYLINLTFLNMYNSLSTDYDAEFFNLLVNLESLILLNTDSIERCYNLEELNLPKLKHLAINSRKIPKFKKLSIEFLTVYGLDELNEELLNQFKGLILFTKFNIVSKIKFSSFKNLVYLMLQLDGLNDEDYIKNFPRLDKGILKLKKKSGNVCVETSVYDEFRVFFAQEICMDEICKQQLIDFYYLHLL